MNTRSLPVKALLLFMSGCLAFSLAGFALPQIALADEPADQQILQAEEPVDNEVEEGVQQEQDPDADLADQPVEEPQDNQAQDPAQPVEDQELQGEPAPVTDPQPEPEPDPDPVLADGFQQDGQGNWIYVEGGVPVTEDFRNVSGQGSLNGRYYFDANGFAVTGLQEIDGKLYYFDQATFKAAKKAWVDIDGERYRFGADYAALGEGRWKIDGKLYWIKKDHSVYKGWKTWDDGRRSYFSPKHKGAAAKGWWTIGGKRYYFNKNNSKSYKGWKTWDDGRKSYFSPKHKGAAAKGWWTIGGKRYYFNKSTRMTMRGLKTINGKRYCFKDNGVMRTDWYQWPSGKWSYFGKNGVQRMGVWYLYGMKFDFVNGKAKVSNTVKFKMCRKAQQYKSPTKWLILTDLTNQYTGIFKGSKGKWILQKYWICSSGMPGITATVASENHSIGYRGYSFGDETYVCYWYTQFFKRCLFHSSPYIPGTNICMDSTMGVPSSRGCIRLRIDRAKWIYDYIPRDTRVVMYGRV